MIPTLQLGGLGRRYATPQLDPQSLNEAILQQSPVIYFRHAEPSTTKTVAVTAGPPSQYNGLIGIVPKPAIYSGGPTCLLAGGEDLDRTWLNSIDLWPALTLTNITLVTVAKFNSLPGGYAPIGLNSDHSERRQYQWRVTSAGAIEFVRIAEFSGPTETIDWPDAVVAGVAAIFHLTITAAGSVKLWKNGVQFGATKSITAANFGTGGSYPTVGFSSGIAAHADAYFSENALIASVVPDAGILKMAQLAGFA